MVVVLIGEGRVGGRIFGLAATVEVIGVVTHGWFVDGRVDVLVGLDRGMSGARRVVVAIGVL